MSSTASLASHPAPSDPPPTRGRPVVPWSWPAGARGLLAGCAIIAAMGLEVASRDVPSTSESIVGVPDLALDPNTAPPRALTALPHIGPALANRIIEARSERPFTSLDDIRDRVRGVGPVTLTRIAAYLRIEPKPG